MSEYQKQEERERERWREDENGKVEDELKIPVNKIVVRRKKKDESKEAFWKEDLPVATKVYQE